MFRVARGVAIAGILAILVQAGCASRTTRPTVTDIRLSLDAAPGAGSPSSPVIASVRVTNAGTTRVWHCQGCGCGNGIGIQVLGPDGAEVLLLDPNRPFPLCADGPAPLEPAAALTSGMTFSGILYRSGSTTFPSPTYSAPAGTYIVVARFDYSTTASGAPVMLERHTTFTWQP